MAVWHYQRRSWVTSISMYVFGGRLSLAEVQRRNRRAAVALLGIATLAVVVELLVR